MAAWGDEPLQCTSDAAIVRLTDLRFYVGGVEIGVDGRPVPVELDAHGRWQGEGLALVDLEDATGSCANGTPDANAVIVARVPAGNARGLRFEVGVPFERNHADPLTAAPPLDDTAMHWHWRSGYKFLRAGIESPDADFSVHLGSAGCEGTVQAVRRCRHPNRVAVELPDWRPGAVVVADLRVLADRLPAAADPGAGAHCESGPGNAVCSALLPAFGLDPESGRPAMEQQLFRLAEY